MSKLKENLEVLNDDLAEFPSSRERREALVLEMEKLEKQEKHCFSCSGMCCTYEFNSMQVSPLEAIDLLNYLVAEECYGLELKELLKENIKYFRLDKEVFVGKGRELRRYYTCPFFLGKSRGCSISRYNKPYGCLAFNPYEKNVSEEGSCTSNLPSLQKREDSFLVKESASNQLILEKLNLDWSKKSISIALQEVIHKLEEL